MDIDQLAQELEMLKSENAAAKQEKRMGGFIDKYGTKFGNDTDIANLILAEMDRLGVDGASEAASDAVQSVLDKLREECTSVLDKTKGALKEVDSLIGKIDDMQQAVDSAQAGTDAPPPAPALPPDAMGALGAETGALPPPGGDLGGEMPLPPEGGEMMPPEGGDLGGAPPMEAGAEGGAPIEGDLGDAGGAPPEAPPAEGAIEPPLPPEQIPSDVRLKNIKSKFAAYAAQRKTATVPSDQKLKNVWKPPKHMLEGVRSVL